MRSGAWRSSFPDGADLCWTDDSSIQHKSFLQHHYAPLSESIHYLKLPLSDEHTASSAPKQAEPAPAQRAQAAAVLQVISKEASTGEKNDLGDDANGARLLVGVGDVKDGLMQVGVHLVAHLGLQLGHPIRLEGLHAAQMTLP